MANLPATLPDLTVREAITGALYRTILAFDTNDESLLGSSLAPGIAFTLGSTVLLSLDELKTNTFAHVGRLDTTHFVTNIRINTTDVEKGEAKLQASALAVHHRPGEGRSGKYEFTSRLLCLCEVVRIGEVRKVRRWDLRIVSSEA